MEIEINAINIPYVFYDSLYTVLSSSSVYDVSFLQCKI